MSTLYERQLGVLIDSADEGIDKAIRRLDLEVHNLTAKEICEEIHAILELDRLYDLLNVKYDSVLNSQSGLVKPKRSLL